MATGAMIGGGFLAGKATGFTKKMMNYMSGMKLHHPPSFGEYDMPNDPSTGKPLRHPSMYQFNTNVPMNAFYKKKKDS